MEHQPTQTEAPPTELPLGFEGFTYADLYRRDRLEDLLAVFVRDLEERDVDLAANYRELLRTRGEGLAAPKLSDVLIALAPHVASFLARLFRVGGEYAALVERLSADEPVVRARRLLQRISYPKWTAETLAAFDPAEDARRAASIIGGRSLADASDPERAFARALLALAEPKDDAEREALDLLARRAAWMHRFGPERRTWVLLGAPESLDYQELVPREHPDPALPELCVGPEETLRKRDGFRLTDRRMKPRGVAAEVEYCILCHAREKDSCSRGLREKDGRPKENPLGIPLAGCPLQEKISEAHTVRRRGESIAALALIMIDNPMCPGTGHRICNDCMKACIYQKQEPVNIPQAETGILTDVLSLPFGAEIYLLLTRWNPLNLRRPVPAPFSGKRVLIVGLGPAGYTLAHYLLNEGFGVVGIDGLKIEPPPADLTGGPGRPPRPIRDFSSLYQELDKRPLAGFGGVSEYGITVRWDKNFLTLIHLALARRETFRAYSGVRFGGTLTIEDCWAMGFDHVAIAAGAGKPTIAEMRGGLSRGIRQASDFLMTLQLTGAFKRESLANLQVRLPAIVIGGGLTAIDTGTEILAYYPIQVEKALDRFEKLAARMGEAAVRVRLDAEEREILDEFLEHGRAVRAERARARAAGEDPNFLGLVREWGGVTIAYRRTLQESPAYRLNHEEVVKALEEGVRFAERLNPVEALLDSHGAVAGIEFARMAVVDGKLKPTGDSVRMPARSVCVAAGTSPNVIYEREHPGTFRLDDRMRYFAPHVVERSEDGSRALRPASRGETGFFTSYAKDGRFVSYYGDNHPIYAGNVVKAMASARDGHHCVVDLFAEEIAQADPTGEAARLRSYLEELARLDDGLIGRVERVERLTPTIIDVVVRSPLAARKFEPGQFYRLQNFETESPIVAGTRLALEGIALTGAWVDKAKGLLSLIVLEMGASSRLCATLKPGQRLVVMGPTGAPTEIPHGEKVLLAGGGLGNAVLFSIAKAMRDGGNRVVYFAGYKDGVDLFKREEIESATDQVIWSTDRGAEIVPQRPQDRHFRGNIVESMVAYATGGFGETVFPLSEVNRILAIGSDRMMAAVKAARHAVLKPHLGPHTAIGSINSSMQCMLKEVCAQCLQQHLDPKTGAPSHAVFTCFCQDQILDEVDFGNLADRLRMNSLQEKLTNLWLELIFETERIERV